VIGAVVAGLAAVCVVHPADADFLVSTQNAGGNVLPDVATNSAGGFAVVWQRDHIVAKIFDAHADPGAEFQVGDGDFPAVGMAPDGEFTVVWLDDLPAPAVAAVFAQRFSSSGSQLGPESTVSNASDNPSFPDVAMDENDRSAIAWVSGNPDVILSGRRYDGAANAFGPPFQISTSTTSIVGFPTIAMAPDGRFVVVWGSTDQQSNIAARLFDSSGSPLGDQFQVNTIPNFADNPSVASDASGNFVVVWNRLVVQGMDYDLLAQRFSSSGSRLGAEFGIGGLVNDIDVSDSPPKVASAADGSFTIVWTRETSNPDGVNILAQRFASDGSLIGPQFQVNKKPGLAAFNPSISSTPDGDFVIAWDGYTLGQSDDNIYAARYTVLHTGTVGGGPGLLGTVVKTKVIDATTQWFWFLHIGEPHYTAEDLALAPKGGATLILSNPATGERASFFLPPGSAWSPLRRFPGGFEYLDRKGAQGPCRKLVAIPGQTLLVRCASAAGTHPFPLAGAAEGSLNVSLRFGTGGELCATTSGGTVVTDTPVPIGVAAAKGRGVFEVKNAPLPDVCELPEGDVGSVAALDRSPLAAAGAPEVHRARRSRGDRHS
jgi:hypothetical protein